MFIFGPLRHIAIGVVAGRHELKRFEASRAAAVKCPIPASPLVEVHQHVVERALVLEASVDVPPGRQLIGGNHPFELGSGVGLRPWLARFALSLKSGLIRRGQFLSTRLAAQIDQ